MTTRGYDHISILDDKRIILPTMVQPLPKILILDEKKIFPTSSKKIIDNDKTFFPTMAHQPLPKLILDDNPGDRLWRRKPTRHVGHLSSPADNLKDFSSSV